MAKILLGLALLIILFCLYLHYSFGLGSWSGKSYDKYLERAWTGQNFIRLPDDVQDFRFYCSNYGVAAHSVAAFTLSETEYNDYMDSLGKFKKDMFYDPNKLVGKTVPETYDYYDERGDFAGLSEERVKKVVRKDVDKYTIVYLEYYAVGGDYTFAVATKPDTREILVYNYGSN